MTSFRLRAVVLDCDDARALSTFYSQMFGWTITEDEGGWVVIRNPDGGTGLSFAQEDGYVRPTWPSDADHQQMMLHLDVLVDDLAAATDRAVGLGATLAEFQPQDEVRVMLDPAGHPFCLFVPGG